MFPAGHVSKPWGDGIRPARTPQGEGRRTGCAALPSQLPPGTAADPGEGTQVRKLSHSTLSQYCLCFSLPHFPHFQSSFPIFCVSGEDPCKVSNFTTPKSSACYHSFTVHFAPCFWIYFSNFIFLDPAFFHFLLETLRRTSHYTIITLVPHPLIFLLCFNIISVTCIEVFFLFTFLFYKNRR